MEIQLTYLAKIKKAMNKAGAKIEVMEGCDILTLLHQYLCSSNNLLKDIIFKDNAVKSSILIYLNDVQGGDLHMTLKHKDEILIRTPIAGG